MLERVLYVIIGVVAIVILVSISSQFFKLNFSQEKTKLSGEKTYVLNNLLNLIYECYEKNRGKTGSVICKEIIVNSAEDINSDEIINAVDTKRIEGTRVFAEDLKKSCEVTIRYENQNIYIETVKYERVGT
jgi:hypothetical protein